MKLIKADVKFNIQKNYKKFTKNTPVKFSIIHNLPDFGLDFNAAFENWNVRTKKFTDESLCEYIKSKDPQIIAMTMGEYNKLNQKPIKN